MSGTGELGDEGTPHKESSLFSTTSANTVLLTVPNHLGVDYSAHVIGAILKHVAPGLGWR